MQENYSIIAGQRIDIWEINPLGADRYNDISYSGIHRPSETKTIYITKLHFLNTSNIPLSFAHTPFGSYPAECRKVGTMIIKSLK